jgi:hypothetical protein
VSISLVGQAGVSGSTETSPHQITYTSTGGNTLILAGLIYSSSVSSAFGLTTITDTAGNTWQLSTSNATNPPAQWAQDPVDGGSYLTFVAWVIAAAAVTHVTYAWNSGTSDFSRVTLSEWSGITAADTGNAGHAASGAATAPFPLTLATNGDLVVGAVDSSSALTVPSGWTTFTSGGSVANLAYGLPEGPGSYTPTWALSPSGDYAGSVMAFNPPVTNVTGTLSVAMAPMKLALTATEVGANITGTLSLALAPMAFAFFSGGITFAQGARHVISAAGNTLDQGAPHGGAEPWAT